MSYIAPSSRTVFAVLWILAGALLLTGTPATGQSASDREKGKLQAGAAKVDITPSQGLKLPMAGYGGRDAPFKGVHDPIYFRAIVVSDGQNIGAFVVGDVIGVGHDLWADVTRRIEEEIGIAQSNVLLAGTHSHGGPEFAGETENPPKDVKSYTDEVKDQIVEVTARAKRNLQPARWGVGVGRANINMNRRARLGGGGHWLGFNPDGPSDKSVDVVRFETLGGDPIAVLINYAVHGTVMGGGNLQITGDLPGSTSRYVENHYGNDVVAIWSSGAAGDQNPIYRTRDNFGGRIQPVKVLGQILGEEVVRVADSIPTRRIAEIEGRQRVITVPGRKPDDGPRFRPDMDYDFVPADSVEIRLSALQLNHAVFTGVSGEVLTLVDQHFEAQAPMKHAIMITNCNGASGYLPNNGAYDKISYEIVVTRVQRGVEDAIIDGLMEMIVEM